MIFLRCSERGVISLRVSLASSPVNHKDLLTADGLGKGGKCEWGMPMGGLRWEGLNKRLFPRGKEELAWPREFRVLVF